MPLRRLAWIRTLLPGALIALAAMANVAAAAPPRPIGNALISAPQLGPDQVDQIRAWAEYYCTRLARSQDPVEIEEARKQLVRPFSTPFEVSETFRFEYTQATLDRLGPIIEGSDLHAAVNALIVVSKLRTSRALDLLLEHCDRRDEARWQIRLRAAAGCAEILGEAVVPERQVNGKMRRIMQAAQQEDRQIVLRRHLQCMKAAATARYPDDVRRQLRRTWAETIRVVVSAMDQPGKPHDLVGAIYAEGPAFRDAFVNPSVNLSEQRELGAQVGPALGSVLDLVHKHAEKVRDDRQLKRLYGNVIVFCQEFLKVIDATERPNASPPQVPFDTLWNGDWTNGDRQQFENGVKSWQSILSSPPYRR